MPENPTYTRACWLFVRVLGFIYLTAFVSFGIQISGLIGSQGILPAGDFLQSVHQQYGSSAYWDLPTIFWWSSSDFALRLVCIAGAICALIVLLGFVQRIMLSVLFVLYLSLFSAGQVFMGYQWDLLLLETGFLAIFLVPDLVRVWLFQWLLFRLMFESGEAKLLSGDTTWRDLTAMAYHYQTQPLPTPVAWYMFQLPLWFQKASTVFTFLTELFVPFLIFGPRLLRHIAAGFMLSLQVLIFLTGNYTFFNLLAMALCISLLDDTFLKFVPPMKGKIPFRAVTAILFIVVFPVSCFELSDMLGHRHAISAWHAVANFAPFGIVNTYGLFANMTTQRLEISVEGSNDGNNWREYGFRYKPGDIKRSPPWVAPHQPRLDWQMWFAALGNYQQNPWFVNFVGALLRGSPPVSGLLQYNPFPNTPPRFIRARAYEYRFTDFAARKATGAWWRREFKGEYFPAVSLKNQK